MINLRLPDPFYWYMVIGYYTLYIPFKPVWKSKENMKLRTNKFQKIICLCGMWILILIFSVTRVISFIATFFQTKHLKVGKYFAVIFHTIHFLRISKFFWIINKKQDEIKEMLEDLQSSQLVSRDQKIESKSMFWRKVGMLYLVLINVSQLILFVLTFIFFGARIGDYVPPNMQFEAAIVNGRIRFFADVNNTSIYKETYSKADIAYGVIELALEFARLWEEYFTASLFFGAIPVTFWVAAKIFESYISEVTIPTMNQGGNQMDSGVFNPIRIIEEYETLKRVADSISSIWSTMTIIWVLEMSICMVYHLNGAVSAYSTLFLVYNAINTAFLAVALIMMAEGCRIVKVFSKWLLSQNVWNQFAENMHEFEWVLRDLQMGGIGIGCAGFFQINYRLISQLMAFIVTFFVISFEEDGGAW
ncbi:unnamed protein product [Orchesella dallaii]|uniref:Gustatory receptor n=1 Tax=Orchesella dallaii TaxID=48710 RepID=A0ABP1RLD2_9HEXA